MLETLAYLATQDMTGILPDVQTPTLVLAAEHSTARNLERARAMAELLPNGRLLAVPGTSGYVQHSAPEKCVAAWREFIAGLVGS